MGLQWVPAFGLVVMSMFWFVLSEESESKNCSGTWEVVFGVESCYLNKEGLHLP